MLYIREKAVTKHLEVVPPISRNTFRVINNWKLLASEVSELSNGNGRGNLRDYFFHEVRYAGGYNGVAGLNQTRSFSIRAFYSRL